MSLRTDYFDGASGIHAKCQDAFTNGVALITSNLTAIGNELKNQAAAGNVKFTITLTTTYNPAYLRGNKGNNLIAKSYLAGVQKGLSDQSIYAHECTPTLNISDTIDTKIDLNFNFQFV